MLPQHPPRYIQIPTHRLVRRPFLIVPVRLARSLASTLPLAAALVATAQTQRAATPTFSVAPGSYPSAQTITITDTTPGATIYYTTDG
ncbi:hypothetical protein DYQ86_22705, partial [Acidobacteria bacterium AB60]